MVFRITESYGKKYGVPDHKYMCHRIEKWYDFNKQYESTQKDLCVDMDKRGCVDNQSCK